jgi:hypothetical protein
MQKIRKNIDIISSTMKNMGGRKATNNWAANDVDGRDNKGITGFEIEIE